MAPPSKLAIATSSLQRLIKEEGSYHKEQAAQEARILQLQEDKSDENAEFILKQERQALEETKVLIPTLRARIEKATETLQKQLDSSKAEGADSEEISKAENVLQEGQKVRQMNGGS